jgi:hypothetical protein
MDRPTLETMLEKPDVLRSIISDYCGPFSLGIIASPQVGEEFALRLKIISPTSEKLPSSVTINGEKITVVATDDYKQPVSLCGLTGGRVRAAAAVAQPIGDRFARASRVVAHRGNHFAQRCPGVARSLKVGSGRLRVVLKERSHDKPKLHKDLP